MDRSAIEELFAFTDYSWRRYSEATIRPLGDDALVKPVPGSGWPALRDALAHTSWATTAGPPTHLARATSRSSR